MAASRPVWSGRRLIAPAIVVLIAALASTAQMRFETAAFADRSGLSHLAAGDEAGGLGYLQQATVANAYDAVYDTQLGGSYMSIGANHGDSAIPGYRPSGDDARTIDPEKAITLGHDQLFQLGQQGLQDAQNLTPLDPDTYNNLGTLFMQSNRPARAIAEFQAGETISPHNPKFLDQIALTQAQEGQLQQAHANARAAFGLDDAYWYTYYALAEVDHKLGNKALARQEASSGLLLAGLTYPPVPASQKASLQSIKKSG